MSDTFIKSRIVWDSPVHECVKGRGENAKTVLYLQLPQRGRRQLLCAMRSPLTRIIVKPADATAPPMVWKPTLPATACAYHFSIPLLFTCGRCGKPICGSCARIFLGIVLCVECLRGTPALPATLAFLPVTYGLVPAYRGR